MTLHVQLLTMITMIIGGVYIGFVFETYRRITFHLRKSNFFNYVFEITFWVTQTFILFYLLYRVNNGEIRVYVFLACLLGFSIYVVVFKHVYQKVLEGIITICTTIIGWIVQAVQALLIQPVLWVLQIMYRLIKGITLFILYLLSFPLKLLLAVIRKLLPESFFKKISKFYAICSTIINKRMYKLKKTIGKWR